MSLSDDSIDEDRAAEFGHLSRAAANCYRAPGVFSHSAAYSVKPVLSFNEGTVKNTHKITTHLLLHCNSLIQ